MEPSLTLPRPPPTIPCLFAGAADIPFMELQQIRALVQDDMAAVDRLIQERLGSDVALINQLGSYVVGSGGKRLRPLVVLLAARACGYQADDHIQMATVVEFIHTATLLHDDVVDESDLRRGHQTANQIWGNEASVLVGDFLYSRAFQMMVELGHMPIMDIMANATNTIAMGEVLQLLNIHDPDVTEQRYLEVIYRKTAALFEAGTETGAVLARLDAAQRQAMAEYGRHLGTAFQLVDDALDYTGDATATGKNVGDDLAEGKPTMPLIHAMGASSPEVREALREAIRQGGRQRIERVIQAIDQCGSIPYTRRLAQAEAVKAVDALQTLQAGPHRDGLERLARFAVSRDY